MAMKENAHIFSQISCYTAFPEDANLDAELQHILQSSESQAKSRINKSLHNRNANMFSSNFLVWPYLANLSPRHITFVQVQDIGLFNFIRKVSINSDGVVTIAPGEAE
jgi:hypothetical protein